MFKKPEKNKATLFFPHKQNQKYL